MRSPEARTRNRDCNANIVGIAGTPTIHGRDLGARRSPRLILEEPALERPQLMVRD